eukprot:TRINITY_DN22649_c0_g1_i3.p1 TRINITY_DN22649_c0_g1~~TRINITY_DN22649_c0_g1_i3.p1  ORF type:complete len:282 (-),score=43.17 TRINITY_DN22649_c0_g1_i3:80-925(-)
MKKVEIVAKDDVGLSLGMAVTASGKRAPAVSEAFMKQFTKPGLPPSISIGTTYVSDFHEDAMMKLAGGFEGGLNYSGIKATLEAQIGYESKHGVKTLSRTISHVEFHTHKRLLVETMSKGDINLPPGELVTHIVVGVYEGRALQGTLQATTKTNLSDFSASGKVGMQLGCLPITGEVRGEFKKFTETHDVNLRTNVLQIGFEDNQGVQVVTDVEDFVKLVEKFNAKSEQSRLGLVAVELLPIHFVPSLGLEMKEDTAEYYTNLATISVQISALLTWIQSYR